MVLFLVASVAFGGDPAPDSDTGDTGDTGTEPAAPAPAPVVIDVVVVKKAPTPAPAPTPPPAPAPAATTAAPPATPAPAAAPTPGLPPLPPGPAKPAPLDVVVVKPGTGAPLGGNITPAPLPPGPVPPPPKDAPPGVPSLTVLPETPAGPAPAATPTGEPAPVPAEVAATPPGPALPVFVPGLGLRVEGDPGEPYRVVDAAARRYTTVQFARLVHDQATLTRLERGRQVSKIGRISAGVAGGVLLVAGLGVVVSDAGAPDTDDFSVNPADYQSQEEYDLAVEFAKGQYDKAAYAWQQQRLGTTLFLVGAGGIALASAPFIGRDDETRESRPDLVYTREQLTTMVEAYNAANPTTPQPGMPVAPAAEPTPADGAAAPAAPTSADPDAPAPSEPAAPAPRAPGRPDPNEGLPPADTFDDLAAPRLHLEPLFGPAWIGVTGSF